jgi:hypothetical protein
MEALDAADRTCAAAYDMTLALHGEAHRFYVVALHRRATLVLARGDARAAAADFDRARVRAEAIESAQDRRYVLAVVDANQARYWWLTRDYAHLRDAMLAFVHDGPDQHPRLGSRAPGAFYYASLARLACRRAPGTGCDAVSAASVESLMREPRAARSTLRLPARIALLEALPPDADPRPAIAALESELAAADPTLPPRHSLRAQAHLALAALRERLGETAAAALERERAADVLAHLPQDHPLRTRSDEGMARFAE